MITKAVKYIQTQTNLVPQTLVVLGSGLGAFANLIENAVEIPYAKIPGFAKTTVAGHAGKLVVGTYCKKPVVAMCGRFHAYEGYTMEEVVFPHRVAHLLGAQTMVVTNAAGGVCLDYGVGDLVLILDHINMAGKNPLIGPNLEFLGERFVDMTHAYDEGLRTALQTECAIQNIALRQGVYAWMHGPSYETPAEIRMLRTLGADLVGMSTVPEVIAARHMQMRVLGLSVVTNAAAGITQNPLSHEEVTQAGKQAQAQVLRVFEILFKKVL